MQAKGIQMHWNNPQLFVAKLWKFATQSEVEESDSILVAACRKGMRCTCWTSTCLRRRMRPPNCNVKCFGCFDTASQQTRIMITDGQRAPIWERWPPNHANENFCLKTKWGFPFYKFCFSFSVQTAFSWKRRFRLRPVAVVCFHDASIGKQICFLPWGPPFSNSLLQSDVMKQNSSHQASEASSWKAPIWERWPRLVRLVVTEVFANFFAMPSKFAAGLVISR